jgi:hypothetical protein
MICFDISSFCLVSSNLKFYKGVFIFESVETEYTYSRNISLIFVHMRYAQMLKWVLNLSEFFQKLTLKNVPSIWTWPLWYPYAQNNMAPTQQTVYLFINSLLSYVSVGQNIQYLILGRLMNIELERMWKEAVLS